MKRLLVLTLVAACVLVTCNASGKRKPPKPTPSPSPACGAMVPDPLPMADATTVTVGCVPISIQNNITVWTHAEVHRRLLEQAPDLMRLLDERLDLYVHVHDSPTGFGSSMGMVIRPSDPPCNLTGSYATCTFVTTLTLQANLLRNQFIPFQYECCAEHTAERIMAHEFGHVWFEYFKLLQHGASYADYIAQRQIPVGTPVHEVAAEDYRFCFGTEFARFSSMAPAGVGPPTPAQCAFLADVWRVWLP